MARTYVKTWKPCDRVTTPDGPGMIIREVKNLYLLRPGRAFEVELDSGKHADYNEHDLTP